SRKKFFTWRVRRPRNNKPSPPLSMQSGKLAVNRSSGTVFIGIFLRVQRPRDIQRQLQASLPAPDVKARPPGARTNGASHRLRQISQRPPAHSWVAGSGGFRSSIGALQTPCEG